jgi:hypothetical protein
MLNGSIHCFVSAEAVSRLGDNDCSVVMRHVYLRIRSLLRVDQKSASFLRRFLDGLFRMFFVLCDVYPSKDFLKNRKRKREEDLTRGP